MTKTLLGALAVGAILVAACRDSGDDGGDGAQREVADMLADVLDEQGVAFDEDCIRDVTSQLSDEDAERLVDAGIDGDAEISEEAVALSEQLQDCVDLAS